jgi:hypothetical protein
LDEFRKAYRRSIDGMRIGSWEVLDDVKYPSSIHFIQKEIKKKETAYV